tara:strand:- start:1004 stop:1156 length:153 start_codon:yes stop_codon:yes gene_type:complete
MSKFYWCHSESDSIGKCDSEEELNKMMEEPFVEPIDESMFNKLKESGCSE